MYSNSMNKAIQSAQKCIDMSCSEQSVSITSAKYLKAFADYLKVLDPSDIDFLKSSVINKILIKKYWDKFSKFYPNVEALIKKLKECETVSANSVITLQNEQKRYVDVLTEFQNESEENKDREYFNQLAVANNLNTILANTVHEHEVLHSRLKEITQTAAQVFKNAILIAKTDYQINMTSNTAAIHLSDSGNTLIYKQDYEKLTSMCNLK